MAEAVLQCFDCHSERDNKRPGWPPKTGKKGGGKIFSEELVAPNLTPDLKTGTGRWSDAQLLSAIRDGVGHDGRKLSPTMGSIYYRQMVEEDLNSVVAYLRSLPPIRNQLPRNAGTGEAATVQITRAPAPDLSTAVGRGRYLATIAGCESCHTPSGPKGPLPGMEFAGGSVLTHMEQTAAAANITSDASGISYYDEGMFIKVMKAGKLGARKISPIMPWVFFRGMTDRDLKDLYAYLRTLRPVKHRVDNTEPATPCRLCGYRHGLGNTN